MEPRKPGKIDNRLHTKLTKELSLLKDRATGTQKETLSKAMSGDVVTSLFNYIFSTEAEGTPKQGHMGEYILSFIISEIFDCAEQLLNTRASDSNDTLEKVHRQNMMLSRALIRIRRITGNPKVIKVVTGNGGNISLLENALKAMGIVARSEEEITAQNAIGKVRKAVLDR